MMWSWDGPLLSPANAAVALAVLTVAAVILVLGAPARVRQRLSDDLEHIMGHHDE